MSSVDTTRFMRPMDLRVTRRNHRRLQVQRILMVGANVLLVLTLASAAVWMYQRTQRDGRFAIERVETTGSVHTSPAAIAKITDRYRGANLFRLDIARLQGELASLPWVERVAIEKKIPNTLMIHVFERQPVALASAAGVIRYVDHKGISFAPLTVAEGNPELPLITGAAPVDLQRTVEFLQSVRRSEPDLYARISEIQPIAPDSYRVFDRDLQTTVLLPPADFSDKWRRLYAIARSNGTPKGALEYADLRFERRIVVKETSSSIQGQVNSGLAASTSAAVTN